MVDIAQSLIASGSFSNDDVKQSKSKNAVCEEASQRLALSSTLCKQEGTFEFMHCYANCFLFVCVCRGLSMPPTIITNLHSVSRLLCKCKNLNLLCR